MLSRGQKQVPERNEMPIKLINQMSETPVKVSARPARLASLHGKTVGLWTSANRVAASSLTGGRGCSATGIT
jgi:hypothetical protein